MKKNISINISGIIFYIEEDGYESLRRYLDSINHYFSGFTGSSEIIADIESRIAEIFLARLKDGKQVITAEDVESLISTMGNVKDFQEDEEKEKSTPPPFQTHERKETKTLYRDNKRRIIGGVCEGFGNYFNIDAMWIRLIFILTTIFWAVGIVVYILLWIFLPVSDNLQESSAKKMFRNPDGKIFGGVASGLASFFGVDAVIIRVLFIVFLFIGGSGIIAYIILWIILPEAKTITDKMQMKGEPITLSNIENSVKRLFQETDSREENILTKVILFPFRLLATIFNSLGTVLSPIMLALVEIVRIVLGVIVMGIGFCILFGVLLAVGIGLGIISPHFAGHWETLNFPLEALYHTFVGWTALFTLIVVAIPGLFLFLLGISIMAKRLVFAATLGWILLGLFIVGSAFIAVSIPQMVISFKENGEHTISRTYDVAHAIPLLKLKEVGIDDYEGLQIKIRGTKGTKIRVEQKFLAQGPTRQKAIENAKSIAHTVALDDSIIWVDSNVTFPEMIPFSAQEVELGIYIPYNVKFAVDKNVRRVWATSSNFEASDMDYDEFVFKKTGLKCLTCKKSDESIVSTNDSLLANFNQIEISGLTQTKIIQGNMFQVSLKGKKKLKKYYTAFKRGNTLYIQPKDSNFRNSEWDDVMNISLKKLEVVITMPHLEKLEINGAGNVKIEGFKESEMRIDVNGVGSVDINCNVDDMDLHMDGASSAQMRGKGKSLNLQVNGLSKIRAYEYHVEDAQIKAHGASSVQVYVTNSLHIEKSTACSVSYRGNPSEIEEN